MSEALERIRVYYPDAETVPVLFSGARIGYSIALEPESEPVGFAATKTVAARRAEALLQAGGSLPEDL